MDALRSAALATLDDCRHPALRAMWDVVLADSKRYARVEITSADFAYFIQGKRLCLANGYIDPTTWSPLEAMKGYLSGDIGVRIFLLKHAITRVYGTVWQPTESQLKEILAMYQVWSHTAIWDIPCPCLNKRMKQFVRDCAWMFAPASVAPIPPPSATIEQSMAECHTELTIVVDESPSIPPVEPIDGPTEPIAEPIVSEPIVSEERTLLVVPFRSVEWFSAEDDHLEEADYDDNDEDNESMADHHMRLLNMAANIMI